jgi:RNA polymerase sigma-B factor
VGQGLAEPAGAREERGGWRELARERALFVRYQRHGDLRAREQLVTSHLGLARALAHRYRQAGLLEDDLIQVASLALVKAVDRYDLERGTRFSSLAVPMILGELKRHLRDYGWGVRVPRGLQERSLAVASAAETLAGELGRAPSAAEIAQRLKLSVEDVLEAREAASARRPEYLDAPTDRDGESRLASVGRDDPALSRVESHRDLGRAISMLTSRERELLRLRFFEDLSQAKIAERMGISQMHVSRLLRQALERTQVVMTDPIRPDTGAHAGRLRAHGSLRLDHPRRERSHAA